MLLRRLLGLQYAALLAAGLALSLPVASKLLQATPLAADAEICTNLNQADVRVVHWNGTKWQTSHRIESAHSPVKAAPVSPVLLTGAAAENAATDREPTRTVLDQPRLSRTFTSGAPRGPPLSPV